MEKLIYVLLSVGNGFRKLEALLAGIKGVSGHVLNVVSFEEIAAVTSDSQKPAGAANKADAMEYAAVIDAIAQQFTLLPVRFGSTMATEDSIRQMLEKNYAGIQDNLQKVEDQYEYGLKIFCDSEKLKAGLREKFEGGDKTPAIPDPEIVNSVSREWVNRKLKEHRFEELLLSHVDSVISEITGNLEQLNAVCKFKKMASPTNIIDAVFLLRKAKKEALIQIISDLQSRHPGLNFVLTGPWPPYNFVDFTVK